MSQTLQSQPNLYKLEGTFGKYRIYTPVNIAEGYHVSRKVQADNQIIYSNSGTTKEQLEKAMTYILECCNATGKFDKTNIAVIANDILYRLKHPVDEHCAIRLGAILSFVEWDESQPIQDSKLDTALSNADIHGIKSVRTITENPLIYDAFYTRIKEDLAMNDPQAYSFFLTWGVVNTPTYREALDISTSTDYFRKRMEALQSLTPQLVSV